MKQYLIAPSILSADFARLGEDTAKRWRRVRMLLISSWGWARHWPGLCRLLSRGLIL
mgnify:CR=1 FL=1